MSLNHARFWSQLESTPTQMPDSGEHVRLMGTLSSWTTMPSKALSRSATAASSASVTLSHHCGEPGAALARAAGGGGKKSQNGEEEGGLGL